MTADFSAAGLRQQLPASLATTIAIDVTEAATSTNRVVAARLAAKPGPLWLLAEQQTAGIGRRGKRFFSPATTGLYMTYGGFAITEKTLPLVTPAAGVALQQAAQSVAGVTTSIKWVNDVLLDGRKVAGILAERLADGQVLVGVGVNLAPSAQQPDVPIDLPLGTLLPNASARDLRPALATTWLRNFTQLLAAPETIMPAYRKHAAWLQQRVTLSGLHVPIQGTVVGFADDGGLQLATETGVQTFSSGSIRLQ